MKTKKISPAHPGEILLHDFMEPLGLNRLALAKAIGFTPMRVCQMVATPLVGDEVTSL